MADSEDESERHRSRDKFRRERSDYDSRRRPGDKREPFDDRSGTHGSYPRTETRGSSDMRSNMVDRGRSPVMDPPPYKRPRREYNDDHRNNAHRRRDTRTNENVEDEGLYRSPLVPFKRFVDSLDDFITEEEACGKFREYKESYSKKHIEEFFENHKSEEWLRLRYHPDFVATRKETTRGNLQHRLAVFMELFKKGFLDDQTVQMDNSERLIRLMDAVVIKLEGGTDEDIKLLDAGDRFTGEDELHRGGNTDVPDEIPHTAGSGHRSEEGEAESDLDADDSEKDERAVMNKSNSKEKEQRVRRSRTQSHNSTSSGHSVHSDKGSVHSTDEEDNDQETKSNGDENSVSPSKSQVKANSLNGSQEHVESCPGSPNGAVEQDAPTPTTAEPPEGKTESEDPLDSAPQKEELTDEIAPLVSDQKTVPESADTAPQKPPKSYPLHKTASIFFRALPPAVTEAELRELCSSQPGFIRLALWDPAAERRFMRHGWVTYKPTVNIKKVCWALNTSPLLREKIAMPNGELGATVNRELAQRVRPLTPLTRHKPIMRQDLMLAAQLTARLDEEHALWGHAEEKCQDESTTAETTITETNSDKAKNMPPFLSAAIKSKNPLLKNLTDYLVEEGGSEEEALLAGTNHNDGEDGGTDGRYGPVVLESDAGLSRVLDQLILYLRIVHSMDFYAGAVYALEDLMPHRCGILHARGDRGLNPTLATGGRSTGLVFSQKEIEEHTRHFAMKLRALIDVPSDLTDEEMKKLGMRDPEKAGEDFVDSNIQKRTGKKKPFKVVWICPLSDKKFREPIFVRKHIFNKHMDKVEAAKKDNAIFFNNYLRDPRRPSLPEAPYHMSHHSGGGGGGGGGHSYRGYRGGRASGGGYRGNYRGNNQNSYNSGSAYGRGAFQDYYDVAAQQQQQHAMAAVAAAAAAALYPNAAADLYTLAAAGSNTGGSSAAGGGGGGAPRPGMRRRANSPMGAPRSYDNRRRTESNYNNNNRRPPYRAGGDRGMVSYNDLDDPGNEVS